MSLSRPAFWSHRSVKALLLWPVSLLFRCLSLARRALYRVGIFTTWQSPVPIVIVGNITVGGAGKTPLVIALAELLASRGHKVGIVTRGYGGSTHRSVEIAKPESDPSVAGDEAILLARRTGLPVAVSAKRVAAVQHLIAVYDIEIVLSDDGLQHYALARDLEIAVVDSAYLFGNKLCLPAGPLREPLSRLNTVDMTVFSGEQRKADGYSLVGRTLVNVSDATQVKPIEALRHQTVHAVAGIASPDKFYQFLKSHDILVIPHEFGDHASFQPVDLEFSDQHPVVMTEKDMVKCEKFGLQNCWYVPVTAVLDDALVERFLSHIESVFLKRGANAGK